MLQICCKSRISLASVPAMSWKARFDSQKNYGKKRCGNFSGRRSSSIVDTKATKKRSRVTWLSKKQI